MGVLNTDKQSIDSHKAKKSASASVEGVNWPFGVDKRGKGQGVCS